MKHIASKVLIGTCLLASASACSDSFLEDKRDYNNMTTIDVFSDKVQANAAYAIFYKQIVSTYNMPVEGSDVLMRHGKDNNGGKFYILADEWAGGTKSGNLYSGANDKKSKAGNHLLNPPYWNNPMNNNSFNDFSKKILFPTVYEINNFIKQIEMSRELINDQTFWDNLKGQAIFTRAWLYFDALRLNGGFPYYNTEEDEPQMGDRSVRMPVEECVNKICEDFQKAAGLLPAKWNEPTDGGRFTSVAAWAMISRVRLYAASPVFNASWDNNSGRRWQAALDASLKAKEEADKAGYGTSVTDINSWDRAFYAFSSGGGMTFNAEAIIKIPKSWTVMDGAFYNKWENQIRPGAVTGKNSAGVRVPELMLAKFPMASGMPATVENGYDDEKFYRNRDPRFYKTFAFSGCEWPGSKTQLWLYAYKYDEPEADRYRYTDGTQNDESAKAKSRAIVWKMSNPNVTKGGEETAGTDILEYRYGEILLNIAECYAAQGNAAECVNYLTKIRNRVGAGTDDLASLSGKYNLIKAVLNERAVELAYEGKRSWDMRRWLLYEGGAGFDPQFAGYNAETNKYDPEAAWGAGWKLYNGTNGRAAYTKDNNILTMLGLPRFCGTKSKTKIWGYDMDNIHHMDVYEGGKFQHPLQDNAALKAVTPITRDMNPAEREAAFDQLEAFYQSVGMQTFDPNDVMGPKYAMDSGSSEKDQNWLFAFRGWYYVYPIHYDMYTEGKGNPWLTQTEGWMTANANPAGGTNMAEQDGTYVYCTAE